MWDNMMPGDNSGAEPFEHSRRCDELWEETKEEYGYTDDDFDPDRHCVCFDEPDLY